MSNPMEIEKLLEQGYASVRAQRRPKGDKHDGEEVIQHSGEVVRLARPAMVRHETSFHNADDDDVPQRISSESPSRGEDSNGDEEISLHDVSEELFVSLSRCQASGPKIEQTPQAIERTNVCMMLRAARDRLRDNAEVIDRISEVIGDTPLRFFDQSLLIVTRSHVWDVFANDTTEAVDALYEWAQANNKKMDAQVLGAVAKGTFKPDPAVKRM